MAESSDVQTESVVDVQAAELLAEPGGGQELTKEDFFSMFRAEQKTIQEDLSKIVGEATGAEGVHDSLDALLARVQALEESFTRAAHILPPYDVQQYRAAVKELTADIAARREQLAPRRKFQFKRRGNASAGGRAAGYSGGVATNVAPEASAPTPSPEAPKPSGSAVSSTATTGEVIEGLCNEGVARCPGELAGQDVTLRGLDGCRIVLLDRVGALHCHELRGCEIYVGAVASSVLIYSCFNCVFKFASKQLRLHDSEAILLSLHTLSGPVIEHSRRIAFAPHDLAYASMEEHLSAAALGRPAMDSTGIWADVQDFNWHKRQASPNWCVLPEQLRRGPVELLDAREAAARDPLPPKLGELERCQEYWEAAGTGGEKPSKARSEQGERAAAAGPAVAAAAKPPPVAAAKQLDSDDEF